MALFAALWVVSGIAQTTPPVIPLWSGGAPGSESRRAEPETAPHPWSIAHIMNPSLVVYAPPAGKANGTSVVICPGGGHTELVVGEEGKKPGELLASQGITCFVLKYRLFREPGLGLTFDKDTKADTFRAMRVVRSQATTWGIDPKKVGMIGFSAGGENLNLSAFGDTTGDPSASDPIDRLSARPDWAVWVYPGPLGIPEQIPADSPPAFLVCAQDDDHVEAVLRIALKYRAAKIPYELHVLSGGGHGFNMGDRSPLATVKGWPQRLTDWLGDRGLLKR